MNLNMVIHQEFRFQYSWWGSPDTSTKPLSIIPLPSTSHAKLRPDPQFQHWHLETLTNRYPAYKPSPWTHLGIWKDRDHVQQHCEFQLDDGSTLPYGTPLQWFYISLWVWILWAAQSNTRGRYRAWTVSYYRRTYSTFRCQCNQTNYGLESQVLWCNHCILHLH